MIDDLLRTMLADNRRLRGGAHDGNDARADRMRDVNASQANAAGGSGDEDRFAGLQACPLDQGIPGGEISLQDGRSRDEIDVGRKQNRRRLLGDHAFRKAAEPTLATDPVARTEARDIIAASDHDTGCVGSGDIREGRPHLIAAAGHQVVHVADRRGMDVDQNLIRRGLRFDGLSEAQGFDTLEGVANNCAQFTLRNLCGGI